MAGAWILTLLALLGVSGGVFLGRSQTLSPHLAAAGGGLLFGISLFWIAPEVAENSGWIWAVLLIAFAFGALFGADRVLHRAGHLSVQALAAPLMTASSLHSFLDGWSVRVLSIDPLASIAAPLGLALHKVPEGLALGLVARTSLASRWQAFAVAAGVESLTLIGAFLEPRADRAGTERFGTLWTSAIMAVIAGSFLFLGVHTVLPNYRVRRVLPVFLATLLAVGMAAYAHGRLGAF